MKPLLWTILAGVCAAGLLVGWADTGFRYHRTFRFPGALWGSGDYWMAPLNIDDRLVKHRHMQLISAPDILILGNSRSMHIDSRMFSPRLALFNASVSAGGIEDYEALWADLKAHQKLPRYALIFLDAGILNAARSPGRYNHFGYDRQAAQGFGAWSVLERGLTQVEDFVGELLNWPAFAAACKYLKMEVVKRWAYFEKRSHVPHPQAAYRPDGSVRNDDAPISREVLIAMLTSQLRPGKVYADLNSWRLNDGLVDRLAALVGDLTAAGCEVLVIVTPVQAWGYERLRAMPKYAHIWNVYPEIILRRLSSLPHASICDTLNVPVCNPDEFRDLVHVEPACLEKIVRHCTTGANLGALLPERVEKARPAAR